LSEPTPSGRELEILAILWERGPLTVRDVHRAMCPNGELAFNSVQTLLRIMDDKGLVEHTAQGRVFVYSARRTREQETRRFINVVFGGAMQDVVVSLIKTKRPSVEELKQLERIIADARRRKEQGGKEKA
jgi:predicted transcriptional regulator